jgi:hypothetical protein
VVEFGRHARLRIWCPKGLRVQIPSLAGNDTRE